ncbi:Ferrous iron permease EfeU [Neobacillus rhizosphaerae]|uniref:Ferrous iron permease EfeU n=1 Tax=Neobacillus rhizosphaerae TaxID=2880965 RepID=A0ABM9ETT5_9BACI|nr:FTR1 family protein [Neobacillus rhizosphaerae]CAH2716082.1 Ferrous iron permease EfeU [Neobacillus rhizosphaerae]
MRCRLFTTLLILLTAFIILPINSFAASATEDMKQANTIINQSIHSLDNGEVNVASEQFKKFTSTWLSIEDGVKKKSQQAYHDIEDNMGQVQFALAQQPINQEKVKNALLALKKTNEEFIAGKFASSDKSDNTSAQKGDVAELITLLNQSLSKIKDNDIHGAKADIEKFRKSWLNVEGIVLTQSSKIYSDAERDMVSSYAMLSSKPADVEGAKKTIESMRDYLSPLVSKTSYNMMDAITILLREGLEGLLVVVALLGFLRKAGHEEKSKWIWIGVGAGIGVSIILGTLVNLLFSAGAFGSNNFLIAGWTGIFAAVMLLYMSYWLHSKSSISEWQRYIRTQSSKALDTGSLLSLALLSFLAVFREGTETVLFFIGMASSIKMTSLLLGIAIGLLILVVLSYLILKVGLKIPMRPFFLVSSILMFYLCFKFTGMGIHGLQLAGLLPATQAPIATIDFFAIYSTWESFIPQMILLVVAVTAAIINKRKDNKVKGQTGGKVNEIA